MGRPKTYDRDEVLEKALLLFWRKGFEGTHLKELVAVTGLNRFSLYKEFGSKDGLFEAAMARYMDRRSVLTRHLQREPPGAENVRNYFRALVDHEFRHGCFLVNTLSEKNVIARSTFQRVVEFVEERMDLFRANLAASRERGELAADTDVDALARFLVVHELGLSTHDILDADRDARKRSLSFLDALL